MNEPLTTPQILEQILFELRMNPNQFAKSIGVTPTQVYDLRDGKVKRISDELADKIRQVHCQYSRVWLITGEGMAHVGDSPINMEDDTDPLAAPFDYPAGDWPSTCKVLINELTAQRKDFMDKIDKQLELLRQSIEQNNTLINKIKVS